MENNWMWFDTSKKKIEDSTTRTSTKVQDGIVRCILFFFENKKEIFQRRGRLVDLVGLV